MVLSSKPSICLPLPKKVKFLKTVLVTSIPRRSTFWSQKLTSSPLSPTVPQLQIQWISHKQFVR